MAMTDTDRIDALERRVAELEQSLRGLALAHTVIGPGTRIEPPVPDVSGIETAVTPGALERLRGLLDGQRHNCWTCEHNHFDRDGGSLCTAGDVDGTDKWVIDTAGWDADIMPPRDSDGCPGWAPKTTEDSK